MHNQEPKDEQSSNPINSKIVLLVAHIVLLDLKIVLHRGLHEIVQADYFHSIHYNRVLLAH